MSFVFLPQLRRCQGPYLINAFSDRDIKNEVMLFNCDFDFALSVATPITKAALLDFKKRWGSENLIIDTRVHMLMPGWFPCIPGWHHDDVPRGADGQPDYTVFNPVRHWILLLNAAVAPTEFLTTEVRLDRPAPGKTVYGEWHKDIEAIEPLQKSTQLARSGDWYEFDAGTFHRGTAAVRSGWRYFMRISRNSTRVPTNEVRRQVQVYLPALTAGW